MLIDTHTHLYDEKLVGDLDTLIPEAMTKGVERFYLPNCDSSTISSMLAVEQKWPDHCFAMMGLHPCYVNMQVEQELAVVQEWLFKRSFAAVGEIGLDYYWDKTFVAEQQMVFRRQIEWSIALKLPIVIHMREATEDTIRIVKEYVSQGVRGVFHCFSGSYETAQKIIDMGFFLGIGGVVTYPKAGLQEVVKKIDLQHLVLETDAPYLSPVPHRGKRNESAYITHVANTLADLKGESVEQVALITSKNALNLFEV